MALNSSQKQFTAHAAKVRMLKERVNSQIYRSKSFKPLCPFDLPFQFCKVKAKLKRGVWMPLEWLKGDLPVFFVRVNTVILRVRLSSRSLDLTGKD